MTDSESTKAYDILFDGRTLVVECVFLTIVDPAFVAERVHAACAGPNLRMTVGGLSRYPGGYKAKTFVNTDESETEVCVRVLAMDPKPSTLTVGVVSERDAKKLWREAKDVASGNRSS